MEATYFNSPHSSLTHQCRDVNSYRTTFGYLLRESKKHSEHQNPFFGETGVNFLSLAMTTNSLAVAYDLLREYPQLASTITSPDDNSNPLLGILIFGMTLDLHKCYPGLDATAFKDASLVLLSLAHRKIAYLSAKRCNSYQRFVYTQIYGLEDAIKYQRFRNQCNPETFQPYHHSTKSFVYYVIERIHAKFWEFAVLLVPHIKQLHQDKVEHTLALAILKIMCEEIVKSRSNHVEQLYLASIVGMLNDTPEVIEQITQICPQVVWATHSLGFSLIRHSIMFRCKNSYNLLKHQLPPDKYFHIASPDSDGNNLLHVAGKLFGGSLDVVTGADAALQVQKDLQWFEEVSTFVGPEEITVKNLAQETPLMLFKNEHNDLRQEAEVWVKKAARSYTITAAFIFAVVLVVVFTVHGRNNGETDKAVYETKSSFTLFAVLDVTSLITSATALLLFRSFDTTRYAYEDFLHNIPKTLIHGLGTLSVSVATMLISLLYIMFVLGSSWIMILIVATTCLPVSLYVLFQLPLLFKLVSSTYGRGISGK
ncbi:uncharacterized protein LOC143563793 isoform X2 [Bidens hawaiensis]|uniref:uncharacterized protein LOC143563793 isoform X2 n=1 Tax=Bidens hawaiensis TaxID=980011 RepID=UPI00404B06BC